MAFFFPLFLVFSLFLLLISPSHSQTCINQNITTNNLYTHCVDLPSLAAYLHWHYDETNSSVSVAFTAPPAESNGWIAWAINPTGTGMIGAQSLIGFKQSNGKMTVKTYNISSYRSIKESKLSLEVWDLGAENTEGVMRIFATVKVPEKTETLNQVWQVGSTVTDGVPDSHSFQEANMISKGSLNLNGKQSGAATTSDSRISKKNIHGVLNAVSWGIMFPMGVIIARYLRTFPSADPVWFYLHSFCQVSAYAMGVAGWASGLKLGSESEVIQHTAHRNIGFALFFLATLQIFALFLRPNKDHKYRFYWNIYHHCVGYVVIFLGILNVFKGLNILNPDQKWKSDYIMVLGTLVVIALLFEAITWVVVCKKRNRKSTKPYDAFSGHSGQQSYAI